jgi:hypothetical protein
MILLFLQAFRFQFSRGGRPIWKFMCPECRINIKRFLPDLCWGVYT